MLKRLDEIRQLGGEVFAVCFTRPDQVRTYLEKYPLEVPILCDPARECYKALQLSRASWRTFANPVVLLKYLWIALRGWLPRKPIQTEEGAEDVLQLGGDFVIDADRRLLYAYRSSNPTDRPSPEAIEKAVRNAANR